MKKLEEYMAELLNQAIYEEYNLVIRKSKAIGLCRYLINSYKGQEDHKPKNKSRLERIYELWYRTVKLPEREKKNHSAYFLMKYITRYYWVIIIPKIFKN